MADSIRSEKLGLKTILVYAQAQLGLNLCSTLLGIHRLYFCADRQHLAPSLVGVVLFTALCRDPLTDPLVGNIFG